MILSASSLTQLQSCARRHALAREWHWPRWRPSALLAHCLRRGWYQLCRGYPVTAVGEDAAAHFMSLAADPGLDVAGGGRGGAGGDVYRLARDHATMLQTMLEYQSRTALPVLRPAPDVQLAPGIGWQMSAWQDDSGALHRLVSVDTWDEDALARELHGWYTIGDMCAANAPMTIHVIEVGQVRDGRRVSPWVRGFKHPTAPNLPVKFRRKQSQTDRHKDRSELAEGYRPVWLSDKARGDVRGWVDLLVAAGMAGEMVRRVDVRQPGEAARMDTLAQVVAEARRMAAMPRWQDVPMSRGACDGMVPCPMQGVCYQPQATPSRIGYVAASATSHTSSTSPSDPSSSLASSVHPQPQTEYANPS